MDFIDQEKNGLCPCGSGKKYRNCCIRHMEIPSSSSGSSNIIAEFNKAMEENEFASYEELQTFFQSFIQQYNTKPIDGFQGLSADQMYRLLYFPFNSPQLVTFPVCLHTPPSAPILTLFEIITEAIGDNGLKPTATGNLPQKLVREAALIYWSDEEYQEYTQYSSIRTEPDFHDLHISRIVAEFAGLLRKYKGKFILSRDCRKLLSKDGSAVIYPRLLRAYAEHFNWAYGDNYPEIELVEESFVFTLYLLHRYGDQWRPREFYEDAFLQAFPRVVEKVAHVSYDTPENIARRCYSWHCLKGFAALMGLIEIEQESNRMFNLSFKLRKLPLLDEAVIFNI